LVTALVGMADAHMQLRTTESGDDVIEQFIDRHPADAGLPVLFAKLDELYASEHRPSRSELEKWVRNPEQPRRTFTRWYLAQLKARTGRRNRARPCATQLRPWEAG